MEAMQSDLTGAWRAIRRAPISSAAAVVTIALGIAANVAVSAVAYGVLLRPLPYRDAGRLVLITTRNERDGGQQEFRFAEARAWTERLRTVSAAAAYNLGDDATVRGAGDPIVVRRSQVIGPFFTVLGTPSQAGQPRADEPGAVVVSAGLADHLRGVGADVPGAALTVGAQAVTVAGEMPEAFDFPTRDVALWTAAEAVPALSAFGIADNRSFTILARMADGVSIEQVRADAERLVHETDAEFGHTGREQRRAHVERLEDRLLASSRAPLDVFVAGGLLVLLIACANVATMLVGRAVARDREYAVRIALGAGRGRLLRSFVAESAIIAAAGAAAGIWVADLAVAAVRSELVSLLPHAARLGVGGPVAFWSVALAMAVAIVCGVAPATTVWRGRIQPLRGITVAGSRGARRLRAALVVVQFALALALVTGASLLGRTFLRLTRTDLGIDPAGSVAVRLMLTESTRFDAGSRAPFINELLRRVRSLPNVRAAGMGGGLPPSYGHIVIGFSSDRGGPMFFMNLMPTTPGYLEAIGARLQRGRMLETADFGTDHHVTVLSTSTARRFFAGRDPIGQPLPFAVPGSKVRPIVVGIVEDVKYGGLDRASSALMFVPWTDFPSGSMFLAAKGIGDPTALAASVRRVIRDLDPGLPVPNVDPLISTIADTLRERRLRALVAVGFAVVAIVVALLGLAGALARAVVERRRELGIRIALGSTPRRTMGLVFREAALLILAGVAAGIPIAALAARALSHMLYGITATDPVTLVLAPMSLAVAALAAGYVPARRASEIDPMALLRE